MSNNNKKVNFILIPGALILISLLLKMYNYLIFHSFVELFCIIIAVNIGIIALSTRKISQNNFFIFLGIAYLFIALTDIFHLLAYKGMGVFNTTSANMATQFWILGRYMEAISLFLAFRYHSRKFSFKKIFTLYIIGSTFFITLIFTGLFPDCYLEETGLTSFKKYSEYIISLILVLTVINIYKKREKFSLEIISFIYLAYLFTIMAEISFTFYQDVYDILNMTGHFFKLLSYYFIYLALNQTALNRPYSLLFDKMHNANLKLRNKSEKLKENQNFTQAILNSLNANITVIDANGKVLTVNEGWDDFGRKNGRCVNDVGRNYLNICRKACQDGEKSACQTLTGLKKVLQGKKRAFYH